MKHKIKRIALILMAFILLFQTPFISIKTYASNIGGGNGGGGEGGYSGSNRTYSNFSGHWSGYRFYLVGDGFTQASNVVDILFDETNLSHSAGHRYSNIRGQAPKLGMPTYLLWSETGLPTPPKAIVDGAGHGTEFKNWMLGPGGGGSSGIQLGGGYTAGGQSGIGNNVKPKPYIPPYVDYNLNEGNPYGGAVIKDLKTAMQRFAITKQKATENRNKVEKIVQTALDVFRKRNTINRKIPQIKSDANETREFVQQIPLAGREEGTADQNALKLLEYLTIRTGSMSINGYNSGSGTIVEYMAENNLKLIVEPVFWLSPNNYNPPADTGYRIYGSMYNIFQLWAQTSYSDTGGNCSPLVSKVGSQCMVTTIPVDFGGVVVSPGHGGSGSIRGQLALMESRVGIGMHIYDVNPFAGTHTWDYPLGDTPGPAPDPSELPGEEGGEGDSSAAKIYNIAKYYEVRDEEGTVIERHNFSRKNNPPLIAIEDEVSYKVEDWHITPDESLPGDNTEYYPTKGGHPVSVEGPGPETVTIGEDDTTLHVLLVKSEEEPEEEEPIPTDVEGMFTLEESEISKFYDTKEYTANWEFKYLLGNLEDCGGHEEEEEDGTYHDANGDLKTKYKTVTKYCETWTLTDNLINIIKQNSQVEAFKNYIAFGDPFTSFVAPDEGIEGERTDTGSTSVSLKGYNYNFVLYRGDDKLVLSHVDYPETQSNEVLKVLEYEKDIVSRLARKKANYSGAMQIEFADAPGCDYVTAAKGDRGCTTSDTTSEVKQTLDASVAIKVYSGKKTGGTIDTSFESGTQGIPLSGYNKVQGRMAKGTEIDFFPIIAMTYQTIEKHTPIIVGVMGEHVRGMIPNSYAEVAWKDGGGENIHITSQQWSVHQRAVKGGEVWNGKNQVLPGGAIYNLDTKGSEQKVVLNTYQPILVGDSMLSALALREDLEEYTEEKADLNHQEFVLEAMETLETLSLVQWVNPNVNAAHAWDGGNEVYPGAPLSGMATDSCSTDKKYYLKDDADGLNVASDEADLDVDIASQTSKYYRIYSDYKGNIYLAEASSTDAAMTTKGSVILTKTQTIEQLSNGRAKMLDQRTGIVTKYVAAIERNTGNDKTASWASDGKWYNEAWTGIIIKADTTELKVGLSDPAIRSTILDPKLCPKNVGQSDLYSKAYVTQYKCAEQSMKGGGHEAGYIASFKGQEIIMKDMDMLFTSKKFYIPNANVQDLN